MEQRTEEWYKARLGIPTASSFSKLITSTGKPSSQAQTYINQLIAERVTGRRPESHTTEAMQRGIDMEPDAIAWYQLMTDNEVIETGFHRHPEIACGASPDGLIGDDGLIEIKCLLDHNHVKAIRANKIPAEYVPQVMGQLWVLQRDYADFLCFHPVLPPMLLTVERDEAYIKLLAEEVTKASETVANEAAKIIQKMEK